MRLKETERAYLAGIIDGEGSIMLCKVNDRHVRVRSQYRYRPVISVGMTDPTVIKWLSSLFKSECREILDPRGNMRLPFYRWMASHKKALKFAKLILPYLKVKKEQAKLLIEYEEKQVAGHSWLTKKEEMEREELHRKIKTLNRSRYLVT